MPMELLRAVADRDLPHPIYSLDALEKLRVLRDAGLITAVLPPVNARRSLPTSRRPALVLSITKKGRLALSVGLNVWSWAESTAQPAVRIQGFA